MWKIPSSDLLVKSKFLMLEIIILLLGVDRSATHWMLPPKMKAPVFTLSSEAEILMVEHHT
jgi:hypothetical protein